MKSAPGYGLGPKEGRKSFLVNEYGDFSVLCASARCVWPGQMEWLIGCSQGRAHTRASGVSRKHIYGPVSGVNDLIRPLAAPARRILRSKRAIGDRETVLMHLRGTERRTKRSMHVIKSSIYIAQHGQKLYGCQINLTLLEYILLLTLQRDRGQRLS